MKIIFCMFLAKTYSKYCSEGTWAFRCISSANWRSSIIFQHDISRWFSLQFSLKHSSSKAAKSTSTYSTPSLSKTKTPNDYKSILAFCRPSRTLSGASTYFSSRSSENSEFEYLSLSMMAYSKEAFLKGFASSSSSWSSSRAFSFYAVGVLQ